MWYFVKHLKGLQIRSKTFMQFRTPRTNSGYFESKKIYETARHSSHQIERFTKSSTSVKKGWKYSIQLDISQFSGICRATRFLAQNKQ